nr:hypothetical protein [uncultured Mediterranean phage uvMED]
MAQHDYDIANQSGANFRADLNNALDAIVSNNSGSSEPSTKFAYEWWIDTSNNLLKLRNSANNAWITLPLSITADNATSGALTVNGNLTTTGTVDINGQELILDADADTSITADTDDQIDFRVGAVDVMTLTNSHLVLKGTTPKITIGDGGEEDTALIFDGNAQDFYVGLDDSADDLIIGKGSTVGTTPAIIIDENLKVGIGTAPATILHTRTQEATANHNAGGGFHHTSSSTAANRRAQVFLDADNGNYSTSSDGAYAYIEKVGDGGNLNIGNQDAADTTFLQGGSEKMRLTSAGKLGFNFTAPAALIDIKSGGSTSTPLRVLASSSTTSDYNDLWSVAEISGSGQMSIFDASQNQDILLSTHSSSYIKGGDFLQGGTSSFSTGVTSLRNRTISSNDFAEVACGGEYATTDTYLVYDTTNSVTRFKVNYQGTVFATSTSISSLSDGRLKENVRELDKGLNDILKLKPVRFDWKAIEGSNKKDITGFIAQECEEAGFEEFVDTYKFNDEIEDAKSFGYSGLIPALVKAIQELEARVKTLEE